MGVLRDWWRENKRKNKEIDKKLSQTFDHERLENESFSEYKRRMKKANRNNSF